MNYKLPVVLILLTVALAKTRRSTTRPASQPTSRRPTAHTATAASGSGSTFSVKRCSLLDFSVFYDNIPSSYYMSKETARTTFNSTIQFFILFGPKQPQCYNVEINRHKTAFVHPSRTNNIGEMRSTLLFKVDGKIPPGGLGNRLTQCISVFHSNYVKHLIVQNVPSILVDGENVLFYNTTLLRERECCGNAPGTYQVGNDLCACSPGYHTGTDSPTGCAPCPVDQYSSKSGEKKCKKCPGKKSTFGRRAATSKDHCYDSNPVHIPDIPDTNIPREIKPGTVVISFTVTGEPELLNQSLSYSITGVVSRNDGSSTRRRRSVNGQRRKCLKGSDSAPGSYFCIYSDRGVIEITDSFRWLDNEQFNITIEVLGENGVSVSQSIKLISKDICRGISPLYTQAELKCSPGPLHEFRADDDDLVTHVVAHRVKEIIKAVINESTNILHPPAVHRLLLNSTSSSTSVDFKAPHLSTTVVLPSPFVVRPKGSELTVQIGDKYTPQPLRLQGIIISLYGIPAATSCKAVNCLNAVHVWKKAAEAIKLCGNDPSYLWNWYGECLAPPKITNPPKRMRVKTGASVTLSCQVEAPSDLTLTIQWYKDGKLLPEVSGGFYSLSSVQTADQGSYICKASTPYGSATSQAAVIVISDMLTTLLNLSVEKKKKEPAPEPEDVVKAVKSYLDNNDKGWTFDVQFKRTVSESSKSLDVELIVYRKVDSASITTYYSEFKELVRDGAKKNKFKPYKIYKKRASIQSAEYCLPEVTGKSRLKGTFDWPLTTIGNSTGISCPYGPGDAQAQRTCVGDFSSGASWSVPYDNSCHFKSKRTQAFDKLAKTKVDKENAKEVANQTKSLTRSAPASEINTADVVFAADILDRIVKAGEIDSTGQDLVDIIDSVLNANTSVLAESQKTSGAASKYVALIESIAANLTVPAGNTSRDLLSPNLLIKVVLPNMATFTKHGYRLASRAASSQVGDSLTADTISTSELPASQVQTGIFLPPGIARRFDNTSDSPVRLALAIYQNHKLFQTVSDDDEDDDGVSVGWSVNSRVISSSVVGVPMNNLTEPIVTTFEPLEQSDMFPECAFWDFVANDGRGNWSIEGCKYVAKSSGRITCHCDHMTNFAVLFTAHGPQSPKADESHALALSIISYIGCAISLLGVLLTLITYALFRSLRKSDAQYILMSLCVALALLLIVFMAGATRVGGITGCRAVAALLHYFMLTVVLWMGVEGYQMYLAFVKVLATYQKNFMLKISVVAWGVPAIIVIITAASVTNSYGNEYYCVLTGIPFYAAMFAPTLIILTGNFAMFFYVMWRLARDTRSAVSADKRSGFWYRCRTALAIMVLLGLTWVFGALAIGDAKLVFEYLFCIFNALQGFFIFVFYCARQPEVRKHWMTICRRGDDMEVSTKSAGTKSHSSRAHRSRSDSEHSQTRLTDGKKNLAFPHENQSCSQV